MSQIKNTRLSLMHYTPHCQEMHMACGAQECLVRSFALLTNDLHFAQSYELQGIKLLGGMRMAPHLQASCRHLLSRALPLLSSFWQACACSP